MPVRELLARIDSRELAEWQAYLQVERQDDARRQQLAEAEQQKRKRGNSRLGGN